MRPACQHQLRGRANLGFSRQPIRRRVSRGGLLFLTAMKERSTHLTGDTFMNTDTTTSIAHLNDLCRTAMGVVGRVVQTDGIRALSPPISPRSVRRLSASIRSRRQRSASRKPLRIVRARWRTHLLEDRLFRSGPAASRVDPDTERIIRDRLVARTTAIIQAVAGHTSSRHASVRGRRIG
jgi:hypothetical protein